ncbi:MAG: hypothetical protein GY869_14725 [Planctomycetes bacterium]|nr:hypothetical protein [Planctomycetota bacterium]
MDNTKTKTDMEVIIDTLNKYKDDYGSYLEIESLGCETAQLTHTNINYLSDEM